METLTFDKLLLKAAFCCMASDGNIDNREIALIKSMCEQNEDLQKIDFEKEINELIIQINEQGIDFIKAFFKILEDSTLTEKEELLLLDFIIKTIYADELVEYTEIKYFKNIRHRLKLSDVIILENYPDVEYWLEDDIKIGIDIEKLTNQFLDIAEMPKFDLIVN